MGSFQSGCVLRAVSSLTCRGDNICSITTRYYVLSALLLENGEIKSDVGAEQCQLCSVDAGERRRGSVASALLVFIFCFPAASAKAAVRLACSD